MSTTSNDEIAALGYERLSVLKTLSPSVLRSLPGSRSEDFIIKHKKVALTVYRKKLPEDKMLFVVQIHRKIFAYSGEMFAAGFILESDGKISEPEPDLLRDYF